WRGSRPKAVHYHWARHGLKRNKRSTSLSMLNMPKASHFCSTLQGTWSIRYWRNVSIYFATSQVEFGTAASHSAKLVTLVITDTQSRARRSSTFIALIHKRFCLTHMPNAYFFLRSLTAMRQ